MATAVLCANFARKTGGHIGLCAADHRARQLSASVLPATVVQSSVIWSAFASRGRSFSSTIRRRSPPLPSPELTLLSPLVERLGELPALLHLTSFAYPYSISIIILTFVLRSGVTLPATLWQRRRTKRLVEEVLPQWEVAKKTVPFEVRKTCRRQGKSYSEFQEELQAVLKIKLTQLLRKYNCSPIPTLVGPLVVSIPLFVLLSALVRQGAVPPTFFSSEILPWWSPPEDLAHSWEQQRSILAEKGLDHASLDLIAGRSGPTLADRDRTMISPIALGMLTMLNVELGAYSRRITSGEALSEPKVDEAAGAKDGDAATKDKHSSDVSTDTESPRTRGITNGLRMLSILFVPIAMQAPSALVIYWLSSASFTLLQNTVFAVLDKQRVQSRQTKRKS